MKDKLGFICSASYGDRANIPKDFWEEQENRTDSKYICFHKRLIIGDWFKLAEYLPEFIKWQEEFITDLEDLKAIGDVNIFLREKIEENIIIFQTKYLQPYIDF